MGFNKQHQPLLVAAGFSDGFAVSHSATVSLSAAQLQSMHTTPVSILPAPGAGNVIVVDDIVVKVVTTSTAYTSGGAVQFQYHSSPNAVVHQGTIPASVITAGAGTTYSFLNAAAGSNSLTAAANDGVDVTNVSAAFATGTGTAVVYIRYRVAKL